MPKKPPKKPFNPLALVKASVRAGDVLFAGDSLHDANYFFNWGEEEIKKCVLKLNDRFHFVDPAKNHYYNTKQHRNYPTENTKYDYYRAKNIMDGESVYLHLFIREGTTTVIIDSFKQL